MPEISIAFPQANPPARNVPTADIVELASLTTLGSGVIGMRGRVASIRANTPELERTLLEIGFIEGAKVEILHEGPFGRDPIAVRVDDMCVALRRKEAAAVLINIDSEGGRG